MCPAISGEDQEGARFFEAGSRASSACAPLLLLLWQGLSVGSLLLYERGVFSACALLLVYEMVSVEDGYLSVNPLSPHVIQREEEEDSREATR